MELEINKELLVNSEYLTTEQFENIRKGDYSDLNFSDPEDETNVRLSIFAIKEDIKFQNRHKNIKHIIKIAEDNDCKWLVFDCDGPMIENYYPEEDEILKILMGETC